jgi:magnesium-transporting ATPase (P-type)
MKGPVETVAQACGLLPPAIAMLDARVSEWALKGYRTLAVARDPKMGTPALLGLATLYDAPRPDAEQVIAELLGLGVPVKMLTGDALRVARELGQGVRLPNIRPWSRFGLAANNHALYTCSFLILLYFAAFSIVSVRERRCLPGTTSNVPWPPAGASGGRPCKMHGA